MGNVLPLWQALSVPGSLRTRRASTAAGVVHESEDPMGMADDQAPTPKPSTPTRDARQNPTRNSPEIRRVLCIGGPLDGKWQNTEERGHQLRILKPARFDYRILSREQAAAEDIRVPFPDYDIYLMEKVALYGEGIWVGLHKDTMDKMDMDPRRGWRDMHTTMILRAILQRDVATEMGL